MFSMMYYKMGRGVGRYPLSCTSVVDHFVAIMRFKLLFTIHHQNLRLRQMLSFSSELVGELPLVYYNNSYSGGRVGLLLRALAL